MSYRVMPWFSYSEQPMHVDAPRQVGLNLTPSMQVAYSAVLILPCVKGQVWPTARDGCMPRPDSMSNELLTNHTLEATKVLEAFPFLYMVIASSQAK
jgi:hypothetical protein